MWSFFYYPMRMELFHYRIVWVFPQRRLSSRPRFFVTNPCIVYLHFFYKNMILHSHKTFLISFLIAYGFSLLNYQKFDDWPRSKPEVVFLISHHFELPQNNHFARFFFSQTNSKQCRFYIFRKNSEKKCCFFKNVHLYIEWPADYFGNLI